MREHALVFFSTETRYMDTRTRARAHAHTALRIPVAAVQWAVSKVRRRRRCQCHRWLAAATTAQGKKWKELKAQTQAQRLPMQPQREC